MKTQARMACLGALLVLCGAWAQADECRLVDRQQADAVKRLVQPGMVLLHYCQSCDRLIAAAIEVTEMRIKSHGPGDVWVGGRSFSGQALRQAVDEHRGPLYAYVADNLAAAPGDIAPILGQLQALMGGETYEVFINGRSQDVAELYLARADGRYENLAHQAGCLVPGVARTLDVQPTHDAPT